MNKEQAGQNYKKQIEELEEKTGLEPKEELLMELGELYYRSGEHTKALNKFNAVLRLNPDNTKANTYRTMINEILSFYHKDRLNP